MTGTRRSVKREAMLSLLRETRVHPTAEWVFRELRPRFPDLSLGTVYRNLRWLVDEGEIISIGVVDGQEHFDGDLRPHAHFLCRCCGRILDVDLDGGDDAARKVEERLGARVTGREMKLWGVCGDCLASGHEIL